MDYNPYRDPVTGRYSSGPKKKKSTPTVRHAKLGISKTEGKRVSSGILTDHPNLKPGESSEYFFGNYYYRFVVNEPGSYRFTQRIQIAGNEDFIKKHRWRDDT